MTEIANAVTWPTERPCEFEMHSWPHLFTATAEGFAKCLRRSVRCYVELGTWCGGSALLAATHMPLAHVVCIDAWDGRGGFQYNQQIATRSLSLCQANLWDYRHRVTLVRADTLTGMQAVHAAGVKPEVVYIDADHHYDPARADITTAMALFHDALICGDDYREPCGRAAEDVAGDRVRVVSGMFWWIERAGD